MYWIWSKWFDLNGWEVFDLVLLNNPSALPSSTMAWWGWNFSIFTPGFISCWGASFEAVIPSFCKCFVAKAVLAMTFYDQIFHRVVDFHVFLWSSVPCFAQKFSMYSWTLTQYHFFYNYLRCYHPLNYKVILRLHSGVLMYWLSCSCQCVINWYQQPQYLQC